MLSSDNCKRPGTQSCEACRCCVEDGVVVLYGTVPSYHAKQVAQMVVMKLERALRIENRCEVEHSLPGNDSNLGSPKGDE